MDVEELAGRGKKQRTARVRELLVTLGVERYRLRVNDLAAALQKSPEGITRILSRGVQGRRTRWEFRETLDVLEREVAETESGPQGDEKDQQ